MKWMGYMNSYGNKVEKVGSFIIDSSFPNYQIWQNRVRAFCVMASHLDMYADKWHGMNSV